jgi:CheY-like chemotaxis protein
MAPDGRRRSMRTTAKDMPSSSRIDSAAGAMQSERKPGQDLTLHVLVIEPEAAALARISALLLDEGVDVSTMRTPVGLFERVSRIEPDVILMDVLIPGLDGNDLARLAARCVGGKPALVVHTKMLKPMLRRVLDVRSVYGVIPKTDKELDFVRSFREISDRLVSEMPTQVFVPRLVGAAMSGTYALKHPESSAASGDTTDGRGRAKR